MGTHKFYFIYDENCIPNEESLMNLMKNKTGLNDLTLNNNVLYFKESGLRLSIRMKAESNSIEIWESMGGVFGYFYYALSTSLLELGGKPLYHKVDIPGWANLPYGEAKTCPGFVVEKILKGLKFGQ